MPYSELEMPLKRPREPIFNDAPWPAVALTAVILGGYLVQSLLPPEQILPRWGYSPLYSHQRPETLVTAIFLHQNWMHAGANAALALAVASPVARYFGTRIQGFAAFLFFYVLCGALANLAFGLIHPKEVGTLIGASGAVSALAAAAARIVAGRGEVGPIRSPLVLGMGAGWLIANLLIAVVGFAPGAGGAAVAWDVHLVGFALGLILVEPIGRLAGHVRVN
jgi:membrane associated rhomboid family serine protease